MEFNLLAKRILFPGLDLHTRCRYRFLPRFFRQGALDTLDAGCGNGALAYAAYKLGNRVLALSKDPREIQKAKIFFSALKADPRYLEFKVYDLYELPKIGRKFDQIICSETLEHIKQDRLVVRSFYDCLRPGGVLHLCAPFALHPGHHLNRQDGSEDGGHVRDGYTLESYRHLLEEAGFEMVNSLGLGSPLFFQLDRAVRSIRNRFGDGAALPLFLLSWPLQWWDRPNPRVPFSLYVQAVKPKLTEEKLRHRETFLVPSYWSLK